MGKKTDNREGYWRERVAAHERSGLSVKQFCDQQQIPEQSFYVWRKRLSGIDLSTAKRRQRYRRAGT